MLTVSVLMVREVSLGLNDIDIPPDIWPELLW